LPSWVTESRSLSLHAAAATSNTRVVMRVIGSSRAAQRASTLPVLARKCLAGFGRNPE
jgi:hypothetical protein